MLTNGKDVQRLTELRGKVEALRPAFAEIAAGITPSVEFDEAKIARVAISSMSRAERRAQLRQAKKDREVNRG